MYSRSPSSSGGMNSPPRRSTGTAVSASSSGRDDQRRLREAQHRLERRPVDGDQEAVHGIGRLVRNAAADEVAHQHRHQRHRQAGGRGHRVGLGERERREQPPLLRLQREDRQERQRDDQQREEQRRPHLDRGLGDQRPALGQRRRAGRAAPRTPRCACARSRPARSPASTIAPSAMAMPPSDRMFALTPCQCMTTKAASTPTGSVDHGDQGRAQVEQEDRAHQRDDDELLDELRAQVVDGAVDQLRAVVGLDDLDARRQAGLRALPAWPSPPRWSCGRSCPSA